MKLQSVHIGLIASILRLRKIVRIECFAVELPEYPKHPNRLPFLGVLGFVDEPSDKAPSGARGHKILQFWSRKPTVSTVG